MPRSGEPTRLKIIEAAEAVFADRGLDAATFAEINELAEQRNNSAAQYHFGDRMVLLEEVVDRHVQRIAKRRSDLFDRLDPDATMYEVVRALVEPVAECLDTDSGRRYLMIQASLLSHPDRSSLPAALARPWERPGIDAVAEKILDRRGGKRETEQLADLKREFASLLLFHALANEARKQSRASERVRMVEALVRSVVAMVNAD